MIDILTIFKLIMEAFFIFFMLYQFLIGTFCFYTHKDKPSNSKVKNRLVAIVAARNEEKVIGQLIESLQNQNYPKDKLDIIVIADNCTDNTAQLARDMGVIVYERFNELEKGKGYAIKYIVDVLLNERKDMYEAFCVFDADNLVMSSYMEEMNEMLNLGYRAAQGYRDIKNPSDSWISANYAIFYWGQNRVWNQPRSNLGLSASVNGTGFMVKMDMVQDRGWITNSMTEDIEFTMNTIAEGIRIGWARNAVVFDEQPITFAESWKQRKRWTTGYIQCMKLCTGKLLKGAWLRKDLKPLDATIFLLGIPTMLIGLFVLILNLILVIMGQNQAFLSVLKLSPILGIVGYIISILATLVMLRFEKKKAKSVFIGMLLMPLFSISWFLLNIVCIFKPVKEWHPIEHNIGVSLHEITNQDKKNTI